MGCGIVNLKTQVIGEKSKNKIGVSRYDKNNKVHDENNKIYSV